MKQQKMMVNVILAVGLAFAPMGSDFQEAQARESEEMVIPALALAPIAYEMMLGITVLFGGSHYAYFADKIALPSVGDTFSLSRLRNLKNQTPKLTEAQHVDHMINNQLLKDYNALQTAIEFSDDGNIDAELVDTFIHQYKTVCATLGANDSGACKLNPELQNQMQANGIVLMSDEEVEAYKEDLGILVNGYLVNRDQDINYACEEGARAALLNCTHIKLANPRMFYETNAPTAFSNCLSPAIAFSVGCNRSVSHVPHLNPCEKGFEACEPEARRYGLAHYVDPICGSAKSVCEQYKTWKN